MSMIKDLLALPNDSKKNAVCSAGDLFGLLGIGICCGSCAKADAGRKQGV